MSRRFSAVAEWYNKPFDYRWMSFHPRVQSLVRLMRYVIAAGVFNFGVVALIALCTPIGPDSAIGRAWLITVIPAQVLLTAFWVLRPFPDHKGIVAFGIYSDVGLATTLFTFADPTDALVGSMLFVITGAFFTFFMSPRWLVAHLIFASSVIVMISIIGYENHIRDTFTIVAAANVVLTSVAGIPLFIQLAWTAMSAEALESNRDPMTRLLNRRGLDSALKSLCARADLSNAGVGIVVVDIDNFKAINDAHGHHIGDVVITEVGAILSAALDTVGVVGRTGGEEYLGAFTAVAEGLNDLLEVIAAAVNDNQHRLPVPVTVSIGAAVLRLDDASQRSHDVLIRLATKAADTNMYAVKARGGNAISAATVV